MKILVDADACPKSIKEIIYRISSRLQIKIILVANQMITIPKSNLISTVQVGQGLDVADQHIESLVEPGDLVITADIPLAALVVAKDGFALNPRGRLYDKDNIGPKLSIRNFTTELRSSGALVRGPEPLNKNDLMQFANALDRFCAQAKKR